MDPMMAAGIQLMGLGMAVVFLFLVVLVAFMGLTGILVRKIEAPGVPPDSTSEPSAEAPRVAALAAAATHHRRRTGGQGTA